MDRSHEDLRFIVWRAPKPEDALAFPARERLRQPPGERLEVKAYFGRYFRRQSWQLTGKKRADAERRACLRQASLPVSNIVQQLLSWVRSSSLERVKAGARILSIAFNEGADEVDLAGKVMVDTRFSDTYNVSYVGIAEPVVPGIRNQGSGASKDVVYGRGGGVHSDHLPSSR